MHVCQWHIDVPFGKQQDVPEIMTKWNRAMAEDQKDFPLVAGRTLVGHIGASASHIINEAVTKSLADWEAEMNVVNTGRFKGFADEIAKYIVPGSQHWVVYRVADEMPAKR